MVIGVTLFVVAVVVIAIWVAVELKRLKHKIFAILLIGLILLVYFSTVVVFRGKDVDVSTVPGLINAVGLYFSFLTSVFSNLVSITSNAIQMDWMGTAPSSNLSILGK